MKKRKIFGSSRFSFFLLGIVLIPVIILGILFYTYILKDLPSPTILSSSAIPQSTQIFDRHDTLLYTIYAQKNQTFVPLSSIPKYMQEATIAIEDKDFYHHGAIDLRDIARASLAIVSHHQLQEGSTLTQQLVKNSLLSPEQTILRKVKEIVLATATEIIYPKNRILEMYLNQTPYGGTAWGIEAAAQTYFGKHASQLDIAECALLAGLPEAPTDLSPFGAHPELAKTRQTLVLKDMYEQGYINQQQEQNAVNEPLQYKRISNQIQAPHFVLWVKELLIEKYGERLVEQGGLRVKTSLDLPLQNYAQASVSAEVAQAKSAHVTNGAALVTNPGTGEILAMVGSANYFDPSIGGNVNLTIRSRQPGSSIKPINYAVGLINGYTAATTFIDQPICFPNPGGKQYCPVNYDGKWHGAVTMRTALGNSFNIPAVKMLKLNGVPAMIATASAMGITTFTNPDSYGLSLTLGGGEIKMVDMATAFGVFANEGYRVDLHPVLKVTDHTGKVLEEYIPPASPIFGVRVLPTGISYIISDILADNNARLMEFGPSSELKIGKNYIPVKTGTTNDFRDNWTIGYTPTYLVAVWVGNNDNTPMNNIASGITGAAPIWHDIMSHVIGNQILERPAQPNTIVQKHACTGPVTTPTPGDTNQQSQNCSGYNEYFIKGTENNPHSSYSTEKTWVDKGTQQQAKPGQTDNVELKDELVVTDPTGDKFCVSCAQPPSPTPNP